MTYGGATYGGVAYGSSGATSPDATVTPATIAATVTIPAVAPTQSAAISPATIAATVTVPASFVNSVFITPAVVTASVAVPSATVTTSLNVNLSVGVIATTTAVPSPQQVGADGEVDAVTVAATVAFPAPTIQTFVNVTAWTEDQSLGTGGVCEWVIEVEIEPPDPTPESGWQPIRTNKVTWPSITVDAYGRPVSV